MEVIEIKHNVRCELGACGNKATHAVKFDRVGIRSRLYACDKCLGELYAAIGRILPPPKSLETGKKKSRDKTSSIDIGYSGSKAGKCN